MCVCMFVCVWIVACTLFCEKPQHNRVHNKHPPTGNLTIPFTSLISANLATLFHLYDPENPSQLLDTDVRMHARCICI